MSYAGASTGAAAVAAIAQAIKASGTIVRVDADEFLRVVSRTEAPLIVQAPAGFFASQHRYLTSYKGLAFAADSAYPLTLPNGAEVIQAKKIWIP